jgi:hypothetical protein
MKTAGVSTSNALRAVLDGRKFNGLQRELAASQGVAPAELSHLAVAILVVGVTEIGVLEDYPELTKYSDVAKVLGLDVAAKS